MEKFNLNIDSYTPDELESLLELKKPYNETEISEKIEVMKQNVSGDNNLDTFNSKNVSDFLDKVAHKLNDYLSFKLAVRESDRAVDTFKDLKNTVNTYDDHHLIVDPMKRIGLNTSAGTGIGPRAPPGKINPIDFRSINKTINIDTRFRDNYENSHSEDFNFTLPMKLSNVLSITLNVVELPASIYNIDASRNDTFDLCGNPIEIPAGIYDVSNSDTNAFAINTQINDIITPMGGTFSIDSKTGKSTISGSGTLDISFGASSAGGPTDVSCQNGIVKVNNSLQSRLGWMLGFRKEEYTGSSSYTSEAPVYLKYPRYVYVCIDDYVNSTNDYFTSAFNQSILNKNIIARIEYGYLQQAEGVRQILTAYPNTSRTYFGPIDIQRMKISLIDEFGNRVNLNKLDWSLVISCEQIYEY